MGIDLSSEELSQLIESLRSRDMRDLAEALQGARLRIVDAPEIGCMAVVLEHCCEIELPASEYARLEALPPLRRQALLDAIAALIQPRWPEVNLAAVEFFRRP